MSAPPSARAGAAAAEASFLHPTAVLFNGGVFKSELLSARTLDTLNGWLASEHAAPARALGGADMDLTLAHVVARKLAADGKPLDPWQMRALTYACRGAKERLLSDASIEAQPLVVPSRGSKLVGGSIRTELTQAEVRTTILEGFFPQVDAAARPVSRTRAHAGHRGAHGAMP